MAVDPQSLSLVFHPADVLKEVAKTVDPEDKNVQVEQRNYFFFCDSFRVDSSQPLWPFWAK